MSIEVELVSVQVLFHIPNDVALPCLNLKGNTLAAAPHARRLRWRQRCGEYRRLSLAPARVILRRAYWGLRREPALPAGPLLRRHRPYRIDRRHLPGGHPRSE